jgi:predicted KAP-like P-loop ATPase
MDAQSKIKGIPDTFGVFFKNLRWKLFAIVLGLLFALLLNLIPKESLQKIIQKYPWSTPLYLFYIVILVLIYNVYSPSEKLFVRYKNNSKLGEPPFTYVHGIVVFLISSILLSFIFIKLYILALIFIPFIGFLIACFFKTSKAQKEHLEEDCSQREKDDDTSLLPDDPIRSPDEDVFGRENFVKDIYKQIIGYPFENSYVFGLFGAWGTGKTSVLNLLRYKLKAEDNKNIIVFDFDPWGFSPEVNLIHAFYENLYKALNQEYLLSGIKNTFNNYLKIISPGLKLHGFGMTINLNYPSPEAIKSEIELCLKNIGKKIVILVDDIDRLDKERIFQVFEIVKRSANLNKTIFVMSFDVDIVSEIFDAQSTNGKSFIDKIIQNPVNLPAIEQSTIKDYVLEKLNLLFNKLQIDQHGLDGLGNFREFYKSHVIKLFSTFRHAIRYLNAVNITLPAIKDEVNLDDFLLLELIRIFYPNIYDDIWNNQSLFIIPSIEFKASLSILYGIDPSYRKQTHDKTMSYLSRIKGIKNYETLEYLLTTLFPLVENALSNSTNTISDQDRNNKRIFVPEVFPIYFMLKVASGEIPDKKIKALIAKWNEQSTDAETIKNDLLAYKNEQNPQLHKLLKKLYFKNTINNTAAEKIVKVLYKDIDAFVNEDFFETRMTGISNLIIYIINDKISSDKVEQIILDLIKHTPSIPLATSVITFCKTEPNGNLYTVYRSIQKNELEKVFSDKLQAEFIQSKEDIFEKYPYYLQSILPPWAIISDQDKALMHQYVFSLINKNPNYLGELITWLNRDTSFKRVFDNKALYDQCKKISDNDKLDQKSKNAIADFIKDYKNTETKRIKEIQEQSNKDKYNKLDNETEVYFGQGKYKEAFDMLEELSRLQSNFAVSLPPQKTDQISCRKWQCLLELSLNNYNLLKEYFDRANAIANDENSIKNLINTSYPAVNDQPNFQIYYCLFYFLKWQFSNPAEKEGIKSLFDVHYQRIKPSTDNKVIQRADELKEKMDIPN